MLKNVYMFIGEEKYLLDQEINRWTSNFLKKFGENSVFVYNIETWDEVSANQSIFGGGLFSEKKLTIIYGLPIDSLKGNTFKISQVEGFVENFLNKEARIPENNLLVFVSNKPDKRSKLFKFLKNNAKLKEFNYLKDRDIKLFILKSLGNIKISNDAISLFIEKVGGQLYDISGEIEKLKLYCLDKKVDLITKTMVDSIVFGMVQTEAFGFVNLLFKNKDNSIEYLQKMKEQGMNWNAFLGALYWSLKLYITIYHFAKDGIKDVRTIAKESGINPFTLSQNIKKLDIILKNGIEIENLYKDLLYLEFDIKTGKQTEESFWLEIKKSVMSFKL